MITPVVGVDRSLALPLHVQLADGLRSQIESGEIPVGSMLADELLLADRLGVSRPTIRHALGTLVDHGLLVRRRGVGTEVLAPPPRPSDPIMGLHDVLAEQGRGPSTTTLSITVGPATVEVAAALGLPAGAEVTELVRLRHADGEPLAILRHNLPSEITVPADESLYEVLRAVGRTPQRVAQTFGARRATAAEARTLRIARGAPVLTVSRTAWDSAGQVVDHGNHTCRADRHQVTVAMSQ